MEKYYLLFFSFFLIIINYSLLKFKILLHQKYTQKHKRFGHNQIPLSGGIYFFFVVLLLFIELNLISFTFVSFFFLYLFIGLIVDQKDNLNPKLRFFLQLLLTTLLVYVSELYILKTNIFLLDYFLQNKLFTIFFTSICIMVLINGTNFLDGVNNNVSGLYLLITLSLAIISKKNELVIDFYFFSLFSISIFIFYIFNFFDKNYLGDSGSYILSIIISILTISFINKSTFSTPILAMNLLWYPAFETLFSILRKKIFKKNPLFPDNLHLHTLILLFLKYKKIKKFNSLSGLLINLTLLPNFIISINYFYSTMILSFTVFLYLVTYVLTYVQLYKFLKNRNLI